MQSAKRAIAGLLRNSSRLIAAQAQNSPLSPAGALWKFQFGDSRITGVSRPGYKVHFNDFTGIGFVWPGLHGDTMQASSVKKKRKKKMNKHKHKKLRRRDRYRTKKGFKKR